MTQVDKDSHLIEPLYKGHAEIAETPVRPFGTSVPEQVPGVISELQLPHPEPVEKVQDSQVPAEN